MARIYTGKGDDGTTSIIGEGRLSKSDSVVDALGSLDELNAFIGNAKSSINDKEILSLLEKVQRDLYLLMADVAAIHLPDKQTTRLAEENVNFIEGVIDQLSQKTDMPSGFILPGANREAAAFGLCRVIARRCERRVVALFENNQAHLPFVLKYLNRLSSLMFVLEIFFSNNMVDSHFKYAKE